VFLLVLDDQLAFRAVDRVSQTYQREPMQSNFEIVLHATRLLYPLLASEDPQLFAHMQASGVRSLPLISSIVFSILNFSTIPG
jgi:hypothetical protein